MQIRPQIPGRTQVVGDFRLFVRDLGDGAEPAVFVHGLGGSSTNWTDLMHLLAPGMSAVAPDLPGFGRSFPSPSGDYTPRGQALAIYELVRSRFPGRRVHLFGNSMGGAISVQLAAWYPDVVRSMTLVSPALPDLMPMRSNVRLPVVAVPGLGPWMMRKMAQAPVERRVELLLDLVYADPQRVSPQRRAEAAAEAQVVASQPWTGPAFLAALKGLLATYFDRGPAAPWRLARRIRVPSLFIYGQEDKLVNPRAAHRVTTAFPDARVVVLPDSGHVSQMEHPELVAGAWRALIGPVA